ncbi:MAG: permease [Bacillaceae bacterium]|nr:permease [Bacillaceae bacterium]
METVKSFLVLALELTVLFIIVSFFIHWIQRYIPFEKMEKFLTGKNRMIGALAAVFFAFITPFCSCSTIPVVVNMLKKKMPFGIVMIFLFASPLLDPTILTIMGVIIGWKVTLIYTVVTSIFSIVIGFTLEYFKLERLVKNVQVSGGKTSEGEGSWREAWKETVDLMKSVFPYLIFGAAIGAIIKGIVPAEWIAGTFHEGNWWMIPIAAVIGIPLYIRISTMIPISHALLVKGMALGPTMALLIGAAGASLPEVVLLNSIFKKQLVALFVASVISIATFSGYMFTLVELGII